MGSNAAAVNHSPFPPPPLTNKHTFTDLAKINATNTLLGRVMTLAQDEDEQLSEVERDGLGLTGATPKHFHSTDNPFEAFFRRPDQERFLCLLMHLVNQDLETDEIVESILVFSKKCHWVENGDWGMTRGDQLWSFKGFHFLERRLFYRVSRLRRVKLKVQPIPDKTLSKLFFSTNLGFIIFKRSREKQEGLSRILWDLVKECNYDSQGTLWYKHVALTKQTLIDYIILASDQDTSPYNLDKDADNQEHYTLGPPSPEEHLPTPEYTSCGFPVVNHDKSVVIAPWIWEYTESKCVITIHEESVYESFIKLIINTKELNKDSHRKIHRAFVSVLVDLSISLRQTTHYIARHILRHSTHCNCTIDGTVWRKGFSLLRWHYPEIKLWSYASSSVIERQPPDAGILADTTDFFKFGWGRSIWVLYNERGYSIQQILNWLLDKCTRNSNTYVLYYKCNRFTEEKLIGYILEIANRPDMPIQSDITGPELSYIGKHNWQQMTTDEVNNAFGQMEKPACIFCGEKGPLMRCKNCHEYAHGREEDNSSAVTSCMESIDASPQDHCKGHIFDNESDYTFKAQQLIMMDKDSSQATIQDITSQLALDGSQTISSAQAKDNSQAQAQPLPAQVQTTSAPAIPTVKTILKATFEKVIACEESKLDHDIKTLQEDVSKTTLYGNPNGINSAVMTLLPASFSSSPDLASIAKRAAAKFITNLGDETEKLASNLKTEILNKRKFLHYEIVISVIIELLSSAYKDKLVRDRADINPMSLWNTTPLNCMTYKTDVENLIEALHNWAKDLIRTNVTIEGPFTTDTAVKLKNAVDHHRHGEKEGGVIHDHSTAWYIKSQDGKWKIPMPFNRRIAVIYIGLCLSGRTKTHLHMQACMKVLNEEVFYKGYVPTATDSLWRQVLSLTPKESGIFAVNTITSHSTLTKANARHFLDGTTIRTLMLLTDEVIKDGRARWTIESTNYLGSLFEEPIKPLLLELSQDTAQKITNTLTAATSTTAPLPTEATKTTDTSKRKQRQNVNVNASSHPKSTSLMTAFGPKLTPSEVTSTTQAKSNSSQAADPSGKELSPDTSQSHSSSPPSRSRKRKGRMLNSIIRRHEHDKSMDEKRKPKDNSDSLN